MTLRPVSAQWFELLTLHRDLARAMECLSRTGAVELETDSGATNRILFPDLAEQLQSYRELARRHGTYWPPAASAEKRRAEHLSDTLKSACEQLAFWTRQADPIITSIERLSQTITDHQQLRQALTVVDADFPGIDLLIGAGPRLQTKLLFLPVRTSLPELPALVLFKSWETPSGNCVLVVGRQRDTAEIEAWLPGLKGRVVPLPQWLPSSPQEAVTAIAERLARLVEERAELNAELAALSARLQVASALGDIVLIEWLSRHVKDLRGSERLAWVTGWTSDVQGEALHRALDAEGVRYIFRLAEPPLGTNPPMVLSNPVWVRPFEVFVRMLGTPSRTENDPSLILAVMAPLIFGFMFGDIGQGMIVFIAGLALAGRIPLARMLVPGGITAMVFGTLFGSVFSREDVVPALWLRPLADPITILIAAVAAGVVIILIGMLLDAVQAHWRGEARRWWGYRAGLLAAYTGVLAAPMRIEGLAIAALGAGWYMLGSAAFAGDGRLGAMARGAAEFVEQALRLLVNTVSFARVGAFALAHAGLSAAIVDVATATGRVGYWIVLVVGNVLVIALEGLVVSIQTTRLLLFEFFIRFLTAGGRGFKPLPPPDIANTSLFHPA